MTSEHDTDKGMTVLKIIWAAIMSSLAVYAIVGRAIGPAMPPAMGREAFATLRLALYALAIATLVASRYVRKLIMSGYGRPADAAQRQPAQAMQRYTGAVIAALAMGESVGVFGLVLYLLGHDEADLYVLLGLAAAALVYHRPRKEELDAFIREGPPET